MRNISRPLPSGLQRQTVSARIYVDQWEGEPITLTPYVRNTYTREDVRMVRLLRVRRWNAVQFVIPDTEGAMIDEIGWILEARRRAIESCHRKFVRRAIPHHGARIIRSILPSKPKNSLRSRHSRIIEEHGSVMERCIAHRKETPRPIPAITMLKIWRLKRPSNRYPAPAIV